MTLERAIHELSRSEYDVVCLLMLTTKFDNTRWPWRRAVAASVVGVAADIERDSNHLNMTFSYWRAETVAHRPTGDAPLAPGHDGGGRGASAAFD